MLSKQQIEFYNEHGYLLVENVVDPEQLARLRDIAYDFIEKSRAVSVSDDVFDLDEGHSAQTPRLTRIKLPHKQHPFFWEVAKALRHHRGAAGSCSAPTCCCRHRSSTPRRPAAGPRSSGTRTGPSIRTPTTTSSPAASCWRMSTWPTVRCMVIPGIAQGAGPRSQQQGRRVLRRRSIPTIPTSMPRRP